MASLAPDPHTFRWEQLRAPDVVDVMDGQPITEGLLWAGRASYPARFHRDSMNNHIAMHSFLTDHPDYRMETRQALVHFENRWQLSVIWGDATYSSNSMFWDDYTHGKRPFIEEPSVVEVGVIVPDYENPHGFPLWGDPLCYVDVPTFQRVAELVMHLPTDIDLPEGEWESAEGFCDFLVAAGLERTL
jgi:hypothetical protein